MSTIEVVLLSAFTLVLSLAVILGFIILYKTVRGEM
jgi:hypothetical protein